MSPFLTTLILCAVSGLLMALARYVPFLGRIGGVLCLLWLAAALPVFFFLNLGWAYVLLFYLTSGTLGLIFVYGGKPA